MQQRYRRGDPSLMNCTLGVLKSHHIQGYQVDITAFQELFEPFVWYQYVAYPRYSLSYFLLALRIRTLISCSFWSSAEDLQLHRYVRQAFSYFRHHTVSHFDHDEQRRRVLTIAVCRLLIRLWCSVCLNSKIISVCCVAHVNTPWNFSGVTQ